MLYALTLALSPKGRGKLADGWLGFRDALRVECGQQHVAPDAEQHQEPHKRPQNVQYHLAHPGVEEDDQPPLRDAPRGQDGQEHAVMDGHEELNQQVVQREGQADNTHGEYERGGITEAGPEEDAHHQPGYDSEDEKRARARRGEDAGRREQDPAWVLLLG